MSERPANSAHQRVVEDYFHTTSSAGCPGDPESFSRSVADIRRRLGHWLDVHDKDVVDLGSGTGELCWVASKSGSRSIVGVNLSQEEIDFSRRRVDAEFVRQDIDSFLAERAPDSIDRIYALNILEHFDKDTLVRVLEDAYRCLREGGQLVAMVPNATSPFGGMTRYWDVTHQNSFTPSSVRQVSRLVGFGDNVDFRECGPVPHGFISLIRFMLWQGIRLLIRGYLMVELASDKGGVYTADLLFRLKKQSRRLGENNE